MVFDWVGYLLMGGVVGGEVEEMVIIFGIVD